MVAHERERRRAWLEVAARPSASVSPTVNGGDRARRDGRAERGRARRLDRDHADRARGRRPQAQARGEAAAAERADDGQLAPSSDSSSRPSVDWPAITPVSL